MQQFKPFAAPQFKCFKVGFEPIWDNSCQIPIEPYGDFRQLKLTLTFTARITYGPHHLLTQTPRPAGQVLVPAGRGCALPHVDLQLRLAVAGAFHGMALWANGATDAPAQV